MTDTPDHNANARNGAPMTGYSWDSLEANQSTNRVNWLSRSLSITVVVLGIAIYAVSLDSPVKPDLPVQLSVFAAIVAAVGLLPSQAGHGWIVVAITGTGFLDMLASRIMADEQGWTFTVVMSINAVQSIAAVGALLQETTGRRSAASAGAADYSAYLRLVEAYQTYATQYQPPPPQYPAAGQGTAQAQADAVAPARTETPHTDAARAQYAAMRAKYAQSGVVGPVQQSRSSAGTASVPIAGRCRDGRATALCRNPRRGTYTGMTLDAHRQVDLTPVGNAWTAISEHVRETTPASRMALAPKPVGDGPG